VNQSPELQALVLPDGAAHKQGVRAVFDSVASGYDDPALRFFPFCADRMVSYLRPEQGWRILDVATGTGALAGALAKVINPGGQVTAIDLSEGMLARAEQNIKKMALDNVDFLQMDAEEPDFSNAYFDAVTCSFGLFFVPDMLKALKQWRCITKPGGTVLFSSFTENAFRPLLDVFGEDLERFGLNVSKKNMSGARLRNADICKTLMDEAGYQEIEQRIIQVGYHLSNVDQWWDAIWNTGMRGMVEQLSPDVQPEFKRVHLARVEKLKTDDGLWMDVEVRLTSGKVT
jgi:ubiquinone/menaquinone biosynthesis C-methylase UbiE